MRFIDEAIIQVQAGKGGPGAVNFRREKYEPMGGPDGGDGGKGGSIVFEATHNLSTLQDFRMHRIYRAEDGERGSGKNCAGRDADDKVIRVPVGTIFRNADTGETLMEMEEDGQRWVACPGGRGGKGNSHFVSSTFQAPKFAQPGEAGAFFEHLQLEMKLLADVGIIGFPNAGKSSLISRISAAHPKVADYAFTTMSPVLGVVTIAEGRSVVMADLPGLIEGAHAGLGLGHKFLRHIERTRVLVHLIDGAQLLEIATRPNTSHQDVADEACRLYQVIRSELGLFNEDLLGKSEIVAINKLDILESDPELVKTVRDTLKRRLPELRGRGLSHPDEPLLISGVSGHGIQPLLHQVGSLLELEAKRSLEPLDQVTVTLPDGSKKTFKKASA